MLKKNRERYTGSHRANKKDMRGDALGENSDTTRQPFVKTIKVLVRRAFLGSTSTDVGASAKAKACLLAIWLVAVHGFVW